MSAELFITKIWNRHRRDIVPVFDHNGICLGELVPDATMTLQTTNPNTLYARWTEVVFKEGGTVEFSDRRGFVPPDLGRWVVEMVNLHGRPCERRYVGGVMEKVADRTLGQTKVVADGLGSPRVPKLKEQRKGGRAIHLPRGIPVRVGAVATDDLAIYSRLEIRVAEKMRPRPMMTGYLETVQTLQDVLIPRSASELQELQDEVESLTATQEEAGV